MSKDSIKYFEEVKVRTYKVIKPFMHFKKDDEVDLVLRLRHTIDSGSWNETYHAAHSQFIGSYYDTILPPKALLDKDFFKNEWDPYTLTEFMKGCNVAKPEDQAASVNWKIDNDEFGLERAKDFILELWFNRINKEHIVTKFNK